MDIQLINQDSDKTQKLEVQFSILKGGFILFLFKKFNLFE